MLNSYIKNRGITQTIIHNNNENHFNEIDWDADYDGNNANISVTSTTDGNKQHFDVKLDNEDLANLLSISSVNVPLHKRLKKDFKSLREDHDLYKIELPVPSPKSIKPEPLLESAISIDDLISSTDYLSSPSSNEELIVPLTIGEKHNNSYTLTSRKQHRRPKTHKTYRVYKKHKHSSRPKSKSKSKTKSSRKTSRSFSIF
jgi:hypothetical protein